MKHAASWKAFVSCKPRSWSAADSATKPFTGSKAFASRGHTTCHGRGQAATQSFTRWQAVGRLALLSAAGLAAVAFPLRAQEPQGGPPGRGGRSAMQARLQQKFKRLAPRVGDRLPDVTVYDAAGKPVRLRALKDQYTVLIFGCLT